MTALIRIDRSYRADGDGRPRPIRFCSRCGHPSEEPPRRPDLRGRVCDRCGMGMMLTCSRDALPGSASAFMIVAFDLAVSAVSVAGEGILGAERGVVGTAALDLITSPLGDDLLASHLAAASQRACDPVVMPVRLRGDRGPEVGTMAARIATCGPPRAALVTVEPSHFGRR